MAQYSGSPYSRNHGPPPEGEVEKDEGPGCEWDQEKEKDVEVVVEARNS
jgi:hypothetical protein